MKMSYSNDDRVKWSKVLIADKISSDESDAEDKKPVLIVKELQWRSEKVDKFIHKLNSKHAARKSEQANRQTKPRLRKGVYSERPVPYNIPSWALLTPKSLIKAV